jgi:hypothetical protein
MWMTRSYPYVCRAFARVLVDEVARYFERLHPSESWPAARAPTPHSAARFCWPSDSHPSHALVASGCHTGILHANGNLRDRVASKRLLGASSARTAAFKAFAREPRDRTLTPRRRSRPDVERQRSKRTFLFHYYRKANSCDERAAHILALVAAIEAVTSLVQIFGAIDGSRRLALGGLGVTVLSWSAPRLIASATAHPPHWPLDNESYV